MATKVYLLPVAVFVVFQTTFICTYIAAILQEHVVPALPYISDAATYSPQSCVFGQFINIGCVLLGTVIYVRYRQIQELTVKYRELHKATKTLSCLALWIGCGSCLGCSIVGNFQENKVKTVHFVGAISCFGFGTVYFWMQAILSYYLQPYTRAMLTAHIRLGMAFLCTFFFILVAVASVKSDELFNGHDSTNWYPSDGGWEYHLASTMSEWIVANIFCFYILSFTNEFRKIQMHHPVIVFIKVIKVNVMVEMTNVAE